MRQHLQYFANLAALVAAYYATGWFGLMLVPGPGHATPVWPPAGLALAWLMIGGMQWWPGILLGAFLVNHLTGVPGGLALIVALGNCAEAAVGAYLVRRGGFRPSLDRVWDVGALALLGAAFATTIAATVGATSMALWGQIGWEQYAHVWTTWWIGDATGVLVVAPLLFTWGLSPPLVDPARRVGAFEAGVLLAVMLIAGLYVFAGADAGPGAHYPIAYVLFLPLIWVALRFDGRGATAATLVLAAISVYAAHHNAGAQGGREHASFVLTAGFSATAALIGLVISATIAERRAVAEQLAVSERRFKQLFEQSADAILLIEGDRVTDCNAAAVRLAGYPNKDALLEKMPADLGRASAGAAAPAAQAFDRVAAEGSSRFEWMLERHDDGRVVPLEVVITAIRAGGRPVMHVVLRDITVRKRIESQLQERQAAAEAANRAKDRFLAALSHELRTPLTPVMANIEILQSDRIVSAVPDARDALDVMRRNVELEARLIDDLLDVTRITRGKLQLEPARVDAHATIDETLRSLAADVGGKRLHVAAELSARQRFVRADPGRLHQVLSNLIRNAIKFTPPEGAITVRTRDVNGMTAAEGARLAIDVIDTGIGIEPDVLPRLFVAFEQGDESIPRRFGGLGLGLSIASALVGAHGGRMSVRSEGRGKGAAFTVELPTLSAEGAAAPGAPSVDSPHAPEPAQRRGGRILIVDDHADTLRSLRMLLTHAGHHVLTASGLSAAREVAAKGEPIDLLISDIGLPDGSGADVLREVRRLHPGTPAIALSGYGMDDDVRRSTEAGSAAHLTKPVDAATLEEAIARMLERGASEGACQIG